VFAILLISAVIGLLATCHGEGQAFATDGVIQFEEGETLGGQFVAVPDSGVIAWQNSAFDGPFTFATNHFSTIVFPPLPDAPPHAGRLGFEFINGDQVFGDLTRIEGKAFFVNTTQFGELVFDASRLRRIYRWNDGQSGSYVGPGPLSGWEVRGTDNAWQERAGQLLTDVPLASIRRNIGLANRSRIELELAWSGQPNFSIAMGTQLTDESAKRAFRIEVWDTSLVLLRELDEMAEVVAIGSTTEAKGKLRLAIDLDQAKNHAIVYSEEGKKLADLQLGSDASQVAEGIQFENVSGNIRLESLRVFTGGGPMPVNERDDVTLASFDEGQQVLGNWTEIRDGQVVIQDGDLTTTADLGRLQVAHWPTQVTGDTSSNDTDAPSDAQVSEEETNKVRCITQGTMRITGELKGIGESVLQLSATMLSRDINIPLAEIRSLQNLVPLAKPARTAARIGVLSLADTQVRGVLEAARANEQASCLRFLPRHALNSANLRASTNGKLVYREPDPPSTGMQQQAQVVPPARARNRGLVGGMMGAFLGGGGVGGGVPSRRLVHLRNGDIVPGVVQQIDAETITIESDVSGQKVISQSDVKAIELSGVMGAPDLEDGKRIRLLTVPRNRKKTPPRHLLVSVSGDYLRGTIVALDSDKFIVENGLESLEVSRRSITKVIFFHEDEFAETATDSAPKPDQDAAKETAEEEPLTANKLVVQAIQRDGVRLSFVPREVGGDELIGDSELLGVCLVNLKTADAILFGSYIEQSTADLPFHRWRLVHAPEPKVLAEGANGDGRNPGMNSPLVGTEAPDFKLKMLDGGLFQVQEMHGRIIVLDFWASWCGPCMQAMPQIDAAIAKFHPDDVKLVTINLQESPEQIRGTLERLGIQPAVALDIDGVAASLYQANAIPQTVIIDREGKIRRVFVGSNPKLGEQIEVALYDLVVLDEPQ
jgi:thiol-disulfide isomerase/thioredoxin